MKKAQVQQVFIYIMVLLVIGAVLLLGTRAIMNFLGKACEVDEVTFKRDLENILNKYSRIGNLGYESIKVPCKNDAICFLNTTINNCADIADPIMQQECELGTGNNVFIKKGTEVIPLFAINNLIVDYDNKNHVCIEARGSRYYLKLEGVGRGNVQVSPDNT